MRRRIVLLLALATLVAVAIGAWILTQHQDERFPPFRCTENAIPGRC